jgi:RNA ligase (TIGR02306 family)
MRKLVTVQKVLEKKSIEGADRIEAVRINGWWVVTQKDQFKVGEYCIYFEVDSFLPIKPEFEFLLNGKSPKKMLYKGKEVEGIRLKTIKLKGQLSQGLVMPITETMIIKEIDEDLSDYFGVILYEQPVPPQLQGYAKGNFPGFIPKTDEERIQNMTEIFNNYVATEKIDGTSATYYKKDGVFGVCSRNLELVKGESIYWRIAEKYNLENIIPDGLCFQGEIIGEGIQGNPLKQTGQDIYFFNVYNIESNTYLDFDEFLNICEKLNLKTVPIINDNFSLPKNVDDMLWFAEGFAEGKSLLNPNVEREGVVVRSKNKINGERISFKAISNTYLLNEK